MTTTRGLGVMVLALGLLGACGGSGIHVASPAATGMLVATSATYLDRIERGMARQDTLDPAVFEDTATLVRLDGQSVCFDVVTQLGEASGSGLAVPMVALDPSTTQLAYDGGTLRATSIMPRRVSFGPPQTGEATNYFVQDDDGVGSHSETTQFQYERVTGGGIVCFEHGGALLPTNHHLRLTYSQVNFTARYDFQIDADQATAWPPGPIVARGYEPLAR